MVLIWRCYCLTCARQRYRAHVTLTAACFSAAGPRSAGGHRNCITTIALLPSLHSAGSSSSRMELCTASLDGKLLFWKLPEGLTSTS
jgi:hypothetical protein